MKHCIVLTSFFALLFHFSGLAQSDTTQLQNELLKVYIDCRTGCDITYFKQSIGYINYVRDPNLADVQILITDFPIASGGTRYDLKFVGKRDFSTFNFTNNFETIPSTSQYDQRNGMLQKIKLGLIPFLMDSPLANKISIHVKESAIRKDTKSISEKDPWNHWVFETYMNGNLNLQQNQRTFNWRLGADINNVTENWRIVQTAFFNLNSKRFIQDEDIIKSKLTQFNFSGRIVKSIDEHWSAGIFEGLTYSTFSNINLGLSLGPAIEFSLFPYKEVTFREITIAYFNRIYYRDYIEETIFGVTQENLWDQAIRVGMNLRKPWGSLFTSLQGRHFFHDFSKNSIEFNNRVSLQVLKGLAFNLTTNFEFINDQLYLPKGEASLEEILLQQRSLSTNYEFFFAMGVSYTFGSIYNNIINTRL